MMAPGLALIREPSISQAGEMMTGGPPSASAPSITLNHETTMPVLGLGTAELSDDETERAVSAALEIGCRLIDTAAVYGNEAAVGRAIAASGIPRAELFVITKVATADQGFTKTQEACSASLDRLGLEYFTLYPPPPPPPPHGTSLPPLARLPPHP